MNLKGKLAGALTALTVAFGVSAEPAQADSFRSIFRELDNHERRIERLERRSDRDRRSSRSRDNDFDRAVQGLVIIDSLLNGNGRGGIVIDPRGSRGSRSSGVYLTCDDKVDAYRQQYSSAARDGRITSSEHKKLETIRNTPNSNGGCTIRRPYNWR